MIEEQFARWRGIVYVKTGTVNYGYPICMLNEHRNDIERFLLEHPEYSKQGE